MRRVVVLGGGHSKFCYNSPKTSVEMLSEVAIDAIRESNLSVKDIQAVNVGNVLGDFSEGQGGLRANDFGRRRH
jgi:acetyl-CoA acetyltransferase